MAFYNSHIKSLLAKIESELIVVELAAWAAYHGDPLPKPDKDRTLLAIRRFEALRGAVNARIK
jgi:hypothetical protein